MAIAKVATSDGLNAAAAAIEAEVAGVGSQVTSVGTQLAGVGAQVTAVGTQVSGISTQVAEIVSGITPQVGALGTQLTALESALQAAINANGPQLGEIRTFASIANIPANFTQTAGAPVSMPSGAFSFNGPADPSLLSTLSWSVLCSDGLHTISVSGASVSSHFALNEGAQAFESRATSASLFPASPVTVVAAGPLASGGMLVAGGSSSSADSLVALKFAPATGAWTQLANLPAGGFGGGDMHVLPDGRTLWLPSHKRIGSSAVANTDTWLYYNETTNVWSSVVAAGSIPTGVLFDTGTATSGIGKGVRLPSGKIMLPTVSSSTDIYIIDPLLNTFTTATRSAGPTAVYLNLCWLIPTPYGAAIVKAGLSTYYTYTESTGVWATVNSYYGAALGAVTTSTTYRPRGYKLLSGLYYLGNVNGATGTILRLDTYNPSGTVQACRTS
ncbi:hypothetical protein SAMN05446935_0334 [Burkholderia sp. YR290]|nr:hypothetical protein SAMN05446935_0334 [Burkholderia sp. YR290]